MNLNYLFARNATNKANNCSIYSLILFQQVIIIYLMFLYCKNFIYEYKQYILNKQLRKCVIVGMLSFLNNKVYVNNKIIFKFKK